MKIPGILQCLKKNARSQSALIFYKVCALNFDESVGQRQGSIYTRASACFWIFFIPDRNSSVVGLGFRNQIDKPISNLWHVMFSCLTFVDSKPAVAIVLESRN